MEYTISNFLVFKVDDLVLNNDLFKNQVIKTLKDDEEIKQLNYNDGYILVTIGEKTNTEKDLPTPVQYTGTNSQGTRDLPNTKGAEMATFKQCRYFKKLLNDVGYGDTYSEDTAKNMTKAEIGKKIKGLQDYIKKM